MLHKKNKSEEKSRDQDFRFSIPTPPELSDFINLGSTIKEEKGNERKKLRSNVSCIFCEKHIQLEEYSSSLLDCFIHHAHEQCRTQNGCICYYCMCDGCGKPLDSRTLDFIIYRSCGCKYHKGCNPEKKKHDMYQQCLWCSEEKLGNSVGFLDRKKLLRKKWKLSNLENKPYYSPESFSTISLRDALNTLKCSIEDFKLKFTRAQFMTAFSKDFFSGAIHLHEILKLENDWSTSFIKKIKEHENFKNDEERVIFIFNFSQLNGGSNNGKISISKLAQKLQITSQTVVDSFQIELLDRYFI